MKSEMILGMIIVNELERRVVFNAPVNGEIIQIDLTVEEVRSIEKVLRRVIAASLKNSLVE